jgi:hypothetical protein
MTCAQFEADCIGSSSMAEAHEGGSGPDAGPGPRLPSLPAPARRFRRLWAVLAYAGLVALGIWLGRLVGGDTAVADAPAPPAPAVVVGAAKPAPQSCLSALRRSDATITLLVRGVRDRRLAETLKAYTRASRTCREEVSAR